MFTEGLCDCKNELFAFVKAWEFLVSWANISFRKKNSAPYAWAVSIEKLPLEFFAGDFVVLFCVIQNDFLSHPKEGKLWAK